MTFLMANLMPAQPTSRTLWCHSRMRRKSILFPSVFWPIRIRPNFQSIIIIEYQSVESVKYFIFILITEIFLAPTGALGMLMYVSSKYSRALFHHLSCSLKLTRAYKSLMALRMILRMTLRIPLWKHAYEVIPWELIKTSSC